MLHKNYCRTGNKSDGVQYDSKLSEAVQCPLGIHIPIVNNCGYFIMNKNNFFFINLHASVFFNSKEVKTNTS